MRFVSIIYIVILLSSCSDVVSSHYATYQDALDDKLFQRGWLPNILPDSTTDITTNNDLDLNTSRGGFTLAQKGRVSFISQLKKQSANTYSYQADGGLRKWIFKVSESGNVTYVLK